MSKLEKRLISFLEKNMLFLTALLITAIALLVRRQNIWYHTSDYIYYFDMHDRNVQSAFYYFWVVMMGNFMDIPLHGIKWVASLADFIVALMLVLIGKWELVGLRRLTEREKWKGMLLYAGCLFAPVVYVRGCVWAQIESFAMAFLLMAFYFLEYRKKTVLGVLFAAVGLALYPFYIVLAVLYFLGINKEKMMKPCHLAAVFAVALLLNTAACFTVNINWKQGIITLVQWISFHPYTGAAYEGVGEWLWQMVILGGYATALLSGLYAFCRKRSYYVAVIVQVLIFICYGIALGW